MWRKVSIFLVIIFFVLLSDAVLSGWLSGLFGEMRVFSIVGAMVVTVAVILLMTTPKKLLLPQEEMKTWE